MVIMSMETYEKIVFHNDTCRKLEAGDNLMRSDDVMDSSDSPKDIRDKLISSFDLCLARPNSETLAAMAEAERISRDPSVKGNRDMNILFAELDGDE